MAARLRLGVLFAAAAAAGSVSAQQNPENSVTVVAPVIITAGVPVPRVGQGAPVWSPQELRQKGYEARSVREVYEDAVTLDCEPPFRRPPIVWIRVLRDASDAARRMSTASRLAENATVKAQRARIAAADGKATMAEVERTELARQAVVIEMVKAELDFEEAKAQLIDIQEMISRQVDVAEWMGELMTNTARRADKRLALSPKEFEDLALENIQVVEQRDGRGDPYLSISGSIVNTRARRITVPPLSITAIDTYGYPLLTDEGEGRGRIGPGEVQRFTYSLKPSPPHTARLTVTFATAKPPGHLQPVRCLIPNYPDHSGTLAPPPPSARTGRL